MRQAVIVPRFVIDEILAVVAEAQPFARPHREAAVGDVDPVEAIEHMIVVAEREARAGQQCFRVVLQDVVARHAERVVGRDCLGQHEQRRHGEIHARHRAVGIRVNPAAVKFHRVRRVRRADRKSTRLNSSH